MNSPSNEPTTGPRTESAAHSWAPVAIVGMACRFPGGPDLSAFWRLLSEGETAVTEGVPGSGVGRVGQVLFPDGPVEWDACRFGAFVDGIDEFDAEFFRISPLEAQLLDPQQRMMLETCWRALEDAGIDPESLAGTRTGVYAGMSNNDYRHLILASRENAEAAAGLYSVTGSSLSPAIGRVSFVLGFEGPAMVVDTACSSSLVAVHQAVAGLHRGDADLALVGGVQAILFGRLSALRAKAGMLSPNGRCKTFDAAADGYVRGEGCGIVVLKRLDEAERDGDRIWAVIRGSAVNQDGTGPGLTVPEGPAQQRAIEDALARAGLVPSEVDYLEAHGTGTRVGDPTELGAAGAVYGRGRDPNRPLLIGSVKTNIGHLESAAGIAGLIKATLALKRGTIPRHLHFESPNPGLDWDRLALKVTAEASSWPDVDRPWRAGVNSFGFSGTNAHVVLESYGAAGTSLTGDAHLAAGPPQPLPLVDVNQREAESVAQRRVRVLPLSGKTEAAVGDLAVRYLGWLDENESTDGLAVPLSDLAWTASMGRSHFPHRAGVVFSDVASLRAGLNKVVAEGPQTQRIAGGDAPKVAFAYTGQASQWIGMGRNIYETEPVAKAVLDRCDALLREWRGTSLIDVMFAGAEGTAEALDDPSWTQPAIYALECALSALWAGIGVRPSVAVGHSLGEIAAAQTAGVFTLEEGLGFAARRGDLIAALPEKGAMAVVFASADVVGAAVEEHNASCEGPGLSMAADNGTNQAISGPERDIEAVLEHFEAQNVRTARLRASPAYHSHLVDPALEELEAYFDSVEVAEPEIVVVSSLTGREVESDARLDGAYWRRQAREQVAFSASIETLAGLGVDVVVEIGPHGVLGPMVSLGWPTADSGVPAVLTSLRRPSRDESLADVEDSFATAVARAYEAGLALDFTGLFSGEERRRIALPGYPFQRHRHWIEAPKRRRSEVGHPLLGVRHESPRGEVDFETELYASDPPWMNDHRVFDHVLAPGALYGAMAVSVPFADGARSATVEDLQIRSPLVFPPTRKDDAGDGVEPVVQGRKVQLVVGASTGRVEIFSKGGEDAEWTLHAEGQVSEIAAGPAAEAADFAELRRSLSARDVAEFYQAKTATGIQLRASFQTLEAIWSGPGEALGEVVLPAGVDPMDGAVHPVLLDGCFQVFSVARSHDSPADETPYLPFGWERLTVTGPLPTKVVCHVRLNRRDGASDTEAEVVTGDLYIYDTNGVLLGTLQGYTVKRATRAALLAAVEGLDELLYQVVWQDGPLAGGIQPADFLPSPEFVADQCEKFVGYLAAEGVGAEKRTELLADLERLSRHYALITMDRLGWERSRGDSLVAEDLRRELGVPDEHRRLFRRMLEMLAGSGVLEETEAGFDVLVGSNEPLPRELGDDTEAFADRMADAYPHGSTEIGLFRRCGGALSEVLRGEADPLNLLFSSGDPSAADLYLKAPVARAANAMLAEAVRTLLAELPDERRLKVLEVGAGTGSATASVLPELPPGRFDYTYTDISAGFFAEAEARFGGAESAIDYRVLDIEKDPVAQGFDAHGYDLLIASNVLHATRYLNETLGHCADLLAPSGHLVALENLRGQGWLDLTFGQLDGWWRFADDYRPHHALAAPPIWRQALADSGFEGVAFVGVDESAPTEPDRGVIVAQGPSEVTEPTGLWVVLADDGGTGLAMADALAGRNQTVVVAGENGPEDANVPAVAGVFQAWVELTDRESWQSLFERLPADVPFDGVVHLRALTGHGASATTGEMAEDTRKAVGSALAMAQGMDDADAVPEKGIWFVTRGAQVLERERDGELVGAALWGFGKVLARETPHWQPRMIDLDPGPASPPIDIADELLAPDAETHIAYRGGRRRVARFVRSDEGPARLELPEEPGWLLDADEGGALDKLRVQPQAARALAPDEVRVAVDAVGLNFWDIFRAMGLFQEGLFGEELVGRVVELGDEVGNVAVGDRVVGLGDGTFGAEAVTHAALVVPAPAGVSTTALATVPSVFVSAALAFEAADLKAGDRVLIHAGAGGLGLAAIELAHAAGAEVIATASAPKREFLRSIGVAHVFDSRTTEFGERVLDVTDGAGVDVIVNSLTGEGFIAASLSCLADGGRFVELARRDIWTADEMAAARPDVGYSVIELDVCKRDEPERAGAILARLVEAIAAGEINPLVHCRWPLAETGSAMAFMQSARHIGKIVLTPPPMSDGALRQDRTYLVTGGLGGIGCVVAGWLADHGAGVIVLNGRREPDEGAQQTIDELKGRGVRVEVELADVTDSSAVDAMLARMDDSLPPLGGVIHSVGVLSDGALSNLSWDRFEQVLWPKVIGAWHLHRATRSKDLDLFVLFSSVTGVLGNAGQANHAAANAFLDQLAGHRRALGLPGQSIAWGAWSGLGEAEEQRERIARQLEAAGTGWMTPEKGLMAFDRLVRQDLTTATVTSVDWPVFAESQDHHPPFLEDMLAETQTDTDESSAGTVDLLADLGSAPMAEREGRLVAFLQQELKAVLRMPTEPSPAVGFVDLGMDSLMAVEFRNRLNRALAGAYVAPNTVVFDYPDIQSLARHLVRELGSDGTADDETDARRQRRAGAEIRGEQENDPIAVIGMACRFPGAPDLDAFWRLLDAGVDAVSEGRRDAGPWPGVAGDPTRHGYRWGGFLDGIDQFDSRFFRILPIEARMMDPRQRLLLEVAWQAVEDAGFDPGELAGSRTGVYAGVGASEYRDLIEASGEEGGYLGTAGSVAAGRLAFALGLTGPAMPVDLACASSLVAVHQASVGLRRGEIDLALVGGANAVLSPGITKFMAELGMLSRRGKCRTFDAGADGFVRGEGCGIVVLKRLADAESDGDRIWGVIRGSAVSHNGVSAGMTVPNGPSQEQAIEEALGRAGVDPSSVDYVEAHGVGTSLGDAIEVRAASNVYGRDRRADRPLLMGTVKTNIGHLEWAAGVAGLIKTILSMQRGMIPKHLHFDNPNPRVDWDELPVRVTAEATPWPENDDHPPRAAVSAFGLSGTNAHVVLERYSCAGGTGRGWASGPRLPVGESDVTDGETREQALEVRQGRLLPLSARSDDALKRLAESYLDWLDERTTLTDEDLPGLLADMAWTAGVGRSHFAHRAGVVFRDAGSLRAGLEAVVADGKPSPALVEGSQAKVAFAYTGEGGACVGMGRDLYRNEPVVRLVLDRCDEAVRNQRGASLLDVMFGVSGDLDDPAWSALSVWALQSALAALWESVGVRPNVVAGDGLGEIAAGQAAGVFGLDEGLLLVTARDMESALVDVDVAPAKLELVSGDTGRAMAADEVLDAAYWQRQRRATPGLDRSVATLANLGVEVVVEIGPQAILAASFADLWPASLASPSVLASQRLAETDRTDQDDAFVTAVAGAYEAGLAITFRGLFAGEARSRISVPGYPFEHRRHWISSPRRFAAAAG
ncbi:MAG: SDR family NAD(P)-dependent oxidoreductase [Gammaproteobacteria bacterium]|nr:SDR family NAD(P)-dependent oxidoreductase [Gammaproteobacteria bacterium]